MTSEPRTLRRGVATMLASGLSNQIGAGVGAHAFNSIGPAGVVAVRQLVAAAVLLPVARPPLRRMTWAQWWPALLLAAVFAVMNLSLYTAIDRIGLGLAVTLEFLGPLAVAVLGSRSRKDVLTAAAAAVGVYVLVLPGPSSDYLGLALAVLAAACWAAYIVLNRVAGSRLPGLQAPAVATGLSAIAYLPVVAVLLAQDRLGGLPLLYAVTAGVLSSVVPYAADLTALRNVPPRLFGVFMSVHPVLAGLAGLVLLGQVLDVHEWLGIGIVVAANALAVATAGPTAPPTSRRPTASRSGDRHGPEAPSRLACRPGTSAGPGAALPVGARGDQQAGRGRPVPPVDRSNESPHPGAGTAEWIRS